MRTTTAVLALCVLVATLGVAPTLVAATPSDAPGRSGDGAHDLRPTVHDAKSTLHTQSRTTVSQVNDSDASANLTEPEIVVVELRENGDARFSIRKEFSIETDAREEAFDELAAEWTSGQHELGLSTYREIVAATAERTGREMEVSGEQRESSRTEHVGVIERQFTWTNFGEATDDRVEVGDAFRDEEGVWQRSLLEGQRLVVEAPSGYAVDDHPPGPRQEGDSLIWEGPRTFEPDDLEMAFARDGDGSSVNLTTIIFVGLGLLLAIGAAALLWRDVAGDDAKEAEPLAGAGAAVGSLRARLFPGAGNPEADGGATAGERTDDSPEQEAAVDPALLSDEERVERLLERNGGRMKQADVVKETGWSNAKVSQLLSEMADAGRVDKLRIGRENLISLPDEDVTDDGE